MERFYVLRHDFSVIPFHSGRFIPFLLGQASAKRHEPGKMYAKILRRVISLVVLGWVYGGIFRLDSEHMRYVSVLGRIGVA